MCCAVTFTPWQMHQHPELVFRLLMPMQSIYGVFSLLMRYTCLKCGINKCTLNKCSPAPHLLTSQPPLLICACVHICIYIHRYVYMHICMVEEISCSVKLRSKGECSPWKGSRVSAHPSCTIKTLM